MIRKKSFSKSRSREEVSAAASINAPSSPRPTSPINTPLDTIITRAVSPSIPISSSSPRSAGEDPSCQQAVEHHISELPTEVLLYTFRYLQLRCFLTARGVCHSWAISMFPLWEQFYKQKWRIAHNTTNLFHQHHLQWRFLFLERSKILYYSHNHLNQYNHLHQQQSEDDNFYQQQQKKKKKLNATSLMEWYNDQGYRFLYNNQFYRALECFELALQIQRNARAYEGMARVYSQLNQYTHVIIFCDAALSQNNALNITELYFLRGKALLNMNRFQESLKDLQKTCQCLGISPVNYHLYVKEIDVLYDKMLCYLELNQLDATFKECQKIIEKDKFMEKGDVLWCCAKNFFAKKRFAEAEFFCEKMQHMSAKTISTHSQEYHLLYMQCQVQTYKFEQAWQHFLESKVMMQGLSAQILMDVALTLFMNQQLQASLDYFVASILQSMEEEEHLQQQQLLLPLIDQCKREVYDSICLQQTQCKLLNVSFFDLQIAWSMYYFLFGKLHLLNFCRSKNRIELREALYQFTRCIALNPTLIEALYFRSLAHCYSILEDVVSHSTTKITHQFVAKKISSSNILKECMHDLNDAISILQETKREELRLQIEMLQCWICSNINNRKEEASQLMKQILQSCSVMQNQTYHMEAVQVLQCLFQPKTNFSTRNVIICEPNDLFLQMLCVTLKSKTSPQ